MPRLGRLIHGVQMGTNLPRRPREPAHLGPQPLARRSIMAERCAPGIGVVRDLAGLPSEDDGPAPGLEQADCLGRERRLNAAAPLTAAGPSPTAVW